MTFLEVSGLSKSFDAVRAVDRVSLEAEQGELLCLLGHSGCGKTTLLRLIAGVEEPDEGAVVLEGRPLDGVPPHLRGVGLMFQDLALFPHMDVFGNVAFGLRMQRASRAEVRRRVDELLHLVDMAGYGQRKVHELSGGERQRVALARALAPAPRLLMLDEPLGSLDRALRDSLQAQVRQLLKEVGVTSIYVTHDRDEAFAVADRVVFMNHGRIVQTGAPEEVFEAPQNEFVARSLGFKNILPGVVVSQGEFVEIDCSIGLISARSPGSPGATEGGKVLLLVDERGVSVRPSADDGHKPRNLLQGTVVERAFRGGEYELKARVGEGNLSFFVPQDSFHKRLRGGDEVSLGIDPGAVRFLGREG